jgi:hypothetical protein
MYTQNANLSEEEMRRAENQADAILASISIIGMSENANAFEDTFAVSVILLVKMCKNWYDVDPGAFKIWWASVVGSVEAALANIGINSPLREMFNEKFTMPTDEEIKEMLKKATK